MPSPPCGTVAYKPYPDIIHDEKNGHKIYKKPLEFTRGRG
jgi:hypothetical protein